MSPTEERIDVEKLKVREQIMFYEEITLFEDELADHGCAMLTAKMVRIYLIIPILCDVIKQNQSEILILRYSQTKEVFPFVTFCFGNALIADIF